MHTILKYLKFTSPKSIPSCDFKSVTLERLNMSLNSQEGGLLQPILGAGMWASLWPPDGGLGLLVPG